MSKPTADQIQTIRQNAAAKFDEEGLEKFSDKDIRKLENDDHYVSRFWLHQASAKGDHMENTVTMVVNTFKWRKDFGVDDITEQNVKQKFKDQGTLYMHNRDKDGKKMLIVALRKHLKGVENMDDLKKYFIYYLERLQREEEGGLITVVYDGNGCGMKNIDMEFVQFIVKMFVDIYPEMVNWTLFFEMPWVFNAAWKVIKNMLPAEAVEKTKFVKKSDIGDYIDDANRLEAWGGDDDYEYVFEPEVVKNVYETPSPKKTQAPVPTSPNSSEDSHLQLNGFRESPRSFKPSQDISNGGGLLHLSPNDDLVFSPGNHGELVTHVHVTNVSAKIVAFKMMTTSPEEYRVKPSMGVIAAGVTKTIELQVVSANSSTVTRLARDKFMVTAMHLDRDDLSHHQIQAVLKTSKPDGQYRLRNTEGSFRFKSDSPVVSSTSSPAKASPTEAAKQLETLLKKINNITKKLDAMEEQMKFEINIKMGMASLIIFLLLVILCRAW